MRLELRKRITISVVFSVATLVSTPAFASGHGGEEVPVIYIVGVVINFLLFIGILYKYAVPAMTKSYATQREELIEHLDAAKKLREQAEEKLNEYKKRLDGLDEERREILDRYHAQGEAERDQLIENAYSQIEKMKANAKTLIEQEHLRAIKDLEKEAVDLAVKLAEDKLKQRVNAETDHRMIAQLSERLHNEAA